MNKSVKIPYHPYFIYLDSKIIGAAKQIVTFFDNGVFPKNNTTVLVKKYKHKSAKLIEKLLKKAQLNYRFVKAEEMDALSQGVVFYPFNAQSNCRMVANRRLKHIFITHGESNKITSIKPIIRIYDYVVTAGQAGIDRFLTHHIFSPYDVDSGRLLTMGDTFVGRTGLSQTGGTPVIFYAPTWEGGIEQENYSSLAYVEQVVETLSALSEQYQVKHIVIRPHPNTGHRKPEYTNYLLEIIKKLQSKSLKLTLFKPHLNISFTQAWKLRHKGIAFKSDLSEFNAVVGLCDISAIETQLLNENIYYYLFCSKENKEHLLTLKNSEYYQTNALVFNERATPKGTSFEHFDTLKNYMINHHHIDISMDNRILNLLEKIK